MSPELARKFADEFVGLFAPALPPSGFEELVSEISSSWPTPMDRFADTVMAFLDNMPDQTTCDGGLLASVLGYSRQKCENKAFVCDLESEMWLCRDCWNEYQRGNWRP